MEDDDIMFASDVIITPVSVDDDDDDAVRQMVTVDEELGARSKPKLILMTGLDEFSSALRVNGQPEITNGSD